MVNHRPKTSTISADNYSISVKFLSVNPERRTELFISKRLTVTAFSAYSVVVVRRKGFSQLPCNAPKTKRYFLSFHRSTMMLTVAMRNTLIPKVPSDSFSWPTSSFYALTDLLSAKSLIGVEVVASQKKHQTVPCHCTKPIFISLQKMFNSSASWEKKSLVAGILSWKN